MVAVTAQPGERLLEVLAFVAPQWIELVPAPDLQTQCQAGQDDRRQQPALIARCRPEIATQSRAVHRSSAQSTCTPRKRSFSRACWRTASSAGPGTKVGLWMPTTTSS